MMDRWIREVNVGKISWRSFTSGGDGSSRLRLMCQRSKNTLVVFKEELESQRFASANRMNVMYCRCWLNVSQCIAVPPRFKNESMYILLYYCITMHHAGIHHATHPCHRSGSHLCVSRLLHFHRRSSHFLRHGGICWWGLGHGEFWSSLGFP